MKRAVLTEEVVLKGIYLSKGVAMGKPYFFDETYEIKKEVSLKNEEIEKEITRYRSALDRSRNEIEKLQRLYLTNPASEVIGILDSHLQMLEDPMITSNIEEKIRLHKKNSESVFEVVISEYKKRFSEVDDEFFQERAQDISDVCRRILNHLSPNQRKSLSNASVGSIIIAKNLLPSDAIEADPTMISAFVTEKGGQNSHSAIITKAKGIAHVAAIDTKALEKMDIQFLIVDGEKGLIVINPKKETVEKYQQIINEKKIFYQSLEKERHLLSETVDGYKVKLHGTLDTFNDLDTLSKSKIQGIGLFRSEYLYYLKKTLPTEEEQFTAYRIISKAMKGKPVVIRAFDLDDGQFEMNPGAVPALLGLRAIRYLLNHQHIFRDQIRALLRASIYGKIHILIPMVTDLSEFQRAKQFIFKIADELKKENIPIGEDISIGCMIEVPSSVIMCDLLAKEADFFSIGSNDLMQYTLAADRNNPYVSHFYSTIHPSILRLLRMIVSAANRNGKEVILCGELAADTQLIPILLGIGIQNFSVSTRQLPFVKNAIRKINIVDVYQKAEKVLEFSTSEEIKDYLENNL